MCILSIGISISISKYQYRSKGGIEAVPLNTALLIAPAAAPAPA